LCKKKSLIDHGDEHANVCFATGQRGWQRPIDGDGDGFAGCDIGSVELAISLYLPAIQR
jgi:hypothetical protein